MTLRKHLTKLTHTAKASQTTLAKCCCQYLLLFPYLLAIFTAMSGVSHANEEYAKLMPCSLLKESEAPGHWHPMASNQTKTSLSVIAPGLNLNPSKLNSIAAFLTSVGSETFIITYKDPIESGRSWTSQVHHALCQAKRKAQAQGIEKVHAIGHSLGALALLDSQFSTYKISPATMTFLAPSLFERFIPSLIKFIDWIPFGSIPSFNIESYRLNASTQLAHYRELRQMREHFFSMLQEKTDLPPVLVFMSPEDELLDFEKTKVFSHERNWGFYKLTPNPVNQKTIHHLIVDPHSMGESSFNFFAQELGKFIGQ